MNQLPNPIPSIGEQNYEGFAQRYAATIRNHPVRLYYEFPASRGLIGKVDGYTILDAGCGGGDYTRWLLENGAQVVACDVMPDFVRLTQEYSEGHAQVYQADLNHPLYFAADNTFDMAVSFLTLHYLEDWSGILGEFYRVLKSGGTLVFSCMHPMTDTEEVNYFQTKLYETEWGNFGDPKPILRLYHRPLMAILNALTRAGFAIVEALEPQPLPEMAHASPQEYNYFKEKPIFLFLKVVKV